MMRSTSIVLLLMAALVGCGEFDVAAPVSTVPDAFRNPGDDPYIVTVSASGRAADVAQSHGLQAYATFEHALNGFAARIPRQAIQGLLRNPYVQTIEPDDVVTADSYAQSDPTWGLDRIDQRALPLDKRYAYTHTGNGVTAYIIDSGIRFDHVDFEGRAVLGVDVIRDGQNGNDCRGHGTHVAGTVGGKTWGVAKQVRLVSVRVLDCNGAGTVSGVISGIDWVIANSQAPAVANLSLGAAKNETLNQAVRKLIASGVQIAVAAGNSNTDACTISPASTLEAVTVGAAGTAHIDDRQTFSNWGDCLDLFAPGAAIVSASHLDATSSVARSGTSMAAPHAAGVMALWLQEDPTLAPTQLQQMIIANATQDVVKDAKSVNAHMLHSVLDGTAAPPPPPSSTPPTASFTSDCQDTDCAFVDQSTPAGGIVRWAWDFGDGSTSTAQNPGKRFDRAGSYLVVQTVTDEDGLTDTATRTILVSEPETDGIQLSAAGTQLRGLRRVTLSWSGAVGTAVDIFRNGAMATVANTGSYVDEFRGGGAVTYSVCDAGTIRCSPEVTVQF
jgi:subtilisin family serine protease